MTVLAPEIRTEVATAKAAFESAVKQAITADEKLIEAKSLVGHRERLPWLEASFDSARQFDCQGLRPFDRLFPIAASDAQPASA